MTARADVEAAKAQAGHAAGMFAEARTEAAALLAEHTAQEVRQGITLHDLAQAAQHAAEAISVALSGIVGAVARRDAASDAAGQALTDAGVPAGQWVNGIRYEPVRTSGEILRVKDGPVHYRGKVIPGRYNVEVETEDGDTAWLGSDGLTRDSRRDVERVIAGATASPRATLN